MGCVFQVPANGMLLCRGRNLTMDYQLNLHVELLSRYNFVRLKPTYLPGRVYG